MRVARILLEDFRSYARAERVLAPGVTARVFPGEHAMLSVVTLASALFVLVGAVAIAQNIPTAALYVTFLSRSIRNVEVHLRSSLVRR